MENGRTMANPAPLGLAAFGITAFLVSSADANLWHQAGYGAFVVVALFYGGIVSILVSIMEFFRGDSIGVAFFGTFGAFWLANWYNGTSKPNPEILPGVFFMCFAAAAFIFWMAVMKRSMLHNLFGLLLTLTLILVTIGNWGGGHAGVVKAGGWMGMLASLVALYMAAKALINEEHGKVLLP